MSPVERVAGLSALGVIVLASVGSVMAVEGRGRFGWWLVVAAACGAMIAGSSIIRGQRSMRRQAAQPDKTSRAPAIHHRDTGTLSVGGARDAGKQRWVRAGRVPSALGYLEIGWLLIVLEVASQGLMLRVRPALMRFFFGIQNLRATPSDGIRIFPAHSRLLQGVELRPPDGPSYYFWAKDRNEVLACLAAAGFTVTHEEQHI